VMSPAAGVHSIVVEADWPLLADAYRARGSLHIVDDLLPVPGETTMPESEFRVALRACEPDRRNTMLFDQVAKLAAKAMGLRAGESLDPSTGFFQLGMDSLMSAMLRRALSDDLGEALPVSVIFDYPTVYSLSAHLATVLPELEATDEPTADAYDELDEDELLAELSERLRGS
jgi:acyl carrier protein